MAYETWTEEQLGNAYVQLVDEITDNEAERKRLQEEKESLEAEMQRRGWEGAWDE